MKNELEIQSKVNQLVEMLSKGTIISPIDSFTVLGYIAGLTWVMKGKPDLTTDVSEIMKLNTSIKEGSA